MLWDSWREFMDCFVVFASLKLPRNDRVENLRLLHKMTNYLHFDSCDKSKCAGFTKETLFCERSEATIEVVAVEVLWFLANFGRETRLMVCERPKFAKWAGGFWCFWESFGRRTALIVDELQNFSKSAKNAPKYKLPTFI